MSDRATAIGLLRGWTREHGRTPTYREWAAEAPFGYGPMALRRIFGGGFNDAIAAAGLEPRGQGRTLAAGHANRNRSGSFDSQLLSPHEREDYGVTVTFADPELRRFVTIARKGKAMEALAVALDGVPPPMGVVAISTPNTIFRDLQGIARYERDVYGQSPEQALLTRAGRSGRLHPSLWPRNPRGAKRYRKAAEWEARRAAEAPPGNPQIAGKP